jgi:hypothetical protein
MNHILMKKYMQVTNQSVNHFMIPIFLQLSYLSYELVTMLISQVVIYV